MDPIYLDHNATTPVHPAVVEAMLPYLREHFGNPSSGHVYGQRARQAITRAREQVAGLLGCQPDEILFTSGGTEANNLAIRGLLELAGPRRHILTSTVEHPATARPCELLERRGIEVTRLPVDGAGRVQVEAARAGVRADTALVTVMLAQNETGTLMPIAALAGLAHERGGRIHTDAAQAVGKLATRVDALGVDLLSIAGHKLYAPKGVGALYVRRGLALAPVLLGAGHERGLRPGTENVASIVGLGAACALAAGDLASESERQRGLRDALWELLRAEIPGLALNGHPLERLPNTLNVSFPGARGSAVLAATEQVAASTGSACHAGSETASAVLTAMGRDAATALGAVRLSLGRSTTPAQVEAAARALVRGWAAARASA
ncbi:MAG TPA: cysteine desulfurase family protein [Myxococcota bacterium]|nr:cysteine desulfurase family protein [Myxococcota bacterium]HRY94573.1 cysteine desulfurase family protein [Myxococcota bacterium]HSA20161.1 cysteine desulfurase family protein [Myxococcota bacterium]